MIFVDPQPGQSITALMLRPVKRVETPMTATSGSAHTSWTTLLTIDVPAQPGPTIQVPEVSCGIGTGSGSANGSVEWAIRDDDADGLIRARKWFRLGSGIFTDGSPGLDLKGTGREVPAGTPVTFVLARITVDATSFATLADTGTFAVTIYPAEEE